MATRKPQQPAHLAAGLRRLQDASTAYCEGPGTAAANLVLRQPQRSARGEEVSGSLLAFGPAAVQVAVAHQAATGAQPGRTEREAVPVGVGTPAYHRRHGL